MEDTPVNNRVAELVAIKQRRERRNLTLRIIEKETGVPKNTIARWMRNDISRFDAHVMDAFLKYFGLSHYGELLVPADQDYQKIETRLKATA